MGWRSFLSIHPSETGISAQYPFRSKYSSTVFEINISNLQFEQERKNGFHTVSAS
jgi:hypothetical protein